jgi:hypothetical protein
MTKYLYIYNDGQLLIGFKPNQQDYDNCRSGKLRLFNCQEGTVYMHDIDKWTILDIELG